MVKFENNKNYLSLVVPFSSMDKQNIVAYLVATYNEKNEPVLRLNRFIDDTNIIGPIQLDTQIEQNETIQNELKELDTTGVRIMKNLVIVPLKNTLLYVEPIYQVYSNEENAVPVLKKVIVAMDSKIAIGNTLQEAIKTMISQDALEYEVLDSETINGLLEQVLKTNQDLESSKSEGDFETIGASINKISQLLRKIEELKKTSKVDIVKNEEINLDYTNLNTENQVINEEI